MKRITELELAKQQILITNTAVVIHYSRVAPKSLSLVGYDSRYSNKTTVILSCPPASLAFKTSSSQIDFAGCA